MVGRVVSGEESVVSTSSVEVETTDAGDAVISGLRIGSVSGDEHAQPITAIAPTITIVSNLM